MRWCSKWRLENRINRARGGGQALDNTLARALTTPVPAVSGNSYPEIFALSARIMTHGQKGTRTLLCLFVFVSVLFRPLRRQSRLRADLLPYTPEKGIKELMTYVLFHDIM